VNKTRPRRSSVREVTTATALGPAVDIGAPVIDRARRGDQEAFAAVIRHYDPVLRALAYRLLGDRDLVEDVLQEAYVKAFRALPRFRGESRLGTWLYRIAYNACLDALRRSRRADELPLEAEVPSRAGDPSDVAARSGDLAQALVRLRPDERATVLLVDAQGFDYRESARILGIPEGTVASRLNRARASLRIALGSAA
jgi:RNA polymerase sigma-70 factor (ECF subfamily)